MVLFKKKTGTEETSIAEYIFNSIDENGNLPEGFELPDTKDKEVKFAAGANDGICMYHMGHNDLSDDNEKRLEELILLAGKGDASGAEKGFKEFCKKHRVISIIDDLQETVLDNEDKLDPNVMFKFAVDLFLHSSDIECVKTGLSILELFDTSDNEELAKAIRNIALCDEFTVFCLFIMRKWPTAEKDILECAKHVHGWGRIHCVDYIEPAEKETKEWLLFNGTDNDIMSAYSAWDVFIKAEVPALIRRGDLSYEEMHAVLKITEGLMDEGPVSGLSNMDNPKVYLGDVLFRSEGNYSFTEEDLKIIENIRAFINRA